MRGTVILAGCLVAELMVRTLVCSAQGLVNAGADLPSMVGIMKVCPTLAEAREQARLSRDFGRLSRAAIVQSDGTMRRTQAPYLAERCAQMRITFRRLHKEFTVQPFDTWTVVYDRDSRDVFEWTDDRSIVHTIHYSIRRQTVGYFVGTFKHPDGKWYEGWVEIPDEPWFLKYLDDREKP